MNITPPTQNGAVVLLSGGLDSTTLLAFAVRLYGAPRVIALSVDYGQRHKIELNAAGLVAGYYDVEHIVIQLDQQLFQQSESNLVDKEAKIPNATYDDLAKTHAISPAYVPYRNGHLISAAATLAMARHVAYVFYGAHAGDALNWMYADCTPDFIASQAMTIRIGTYNQVGLQAPFQLMTKADIVKWGHEWGAPYKKTYSCYTGEQPSCGSCPTCRERLAAFAVNDLTDPIDYKDVSMWTGPDEKPRVHFPKIEPTEGVPKCGSSGVPLPLGSTSNEVVHPPMPIDHCIRERINLR